MAEKKTKIRDDSPYCICGFEPQRLEPLLD